MRIPKKDIINSALQAGAVTTIDRLLSVCHILHEVAALLSDQADTIAQSYGLKVGEVKHYGRLHSESFDRYHLMWRTFMREIGATQSQDDDLALYLPQIVRLFAIEAYVIDPETGRPYLDGPVIAPTAAQPRLHVLEGAESKLALPVCRYRADTLTPEQEKALGPQRKLTVMTHSRLTHLYEILAHEQGRTKREVINQALIDYVNNLEQ